MGNLTSIIFKNRQHENFYNEYLEKCRYKDVYHMAYAMSVANFLSGLERCLGILFEKAHQTHQSKENSGKCRKICYNKDKPYRKC